jgi:hypothetical protein
LKKQKQWAGVKPDPLFIQKAESDGTEKDQQLKEADFFTSAALRSAIASRSGVKSIVSRSVSGILDGLDHLLNHPLA